MNVEPFLPCPCVVWLNTLYSPPLAQSPLAAQRGPPLHHDAWQRPGQKAGPLQAHGRGGQARLGRGPAGFRPEEEGGGPAWVSSDASLFWEGNWR